MPRYNDFREKLRKPRIKKFEDLTDEPKWVEEIREVYDGDIDARRPPGRAARRAAAAGLRLQRHGVPDLHPDGSRRLKSDRFFTNDYTPEVYTQEGLDWVENSTMVDVLLRHHPELGAGARGLPERVRALAQARLSGAELRDA